MKKELKIRQRYFGVLLLFCLLISCSKEGDQGPIGAQGEKGEQGLTGQQGEDGEPGTATVIYSDWFPSEFSDDILTVSENFKVEAPDLTLEIIEKGLLLVYGRRTNVIDAGLIEQLPHSVFFRKQYYYHRFIGGANNLEGEFLIILESMDPSPAGTPFFDEYRYILAPGGISCVW